MYFSVPSVCDAAGYEGYTRDSINIWGLAAIIVFYLVILAIGIFASWKSGAWKKGDDTEELMVAGRNIGLVVGFVSLGTKKRPFAELANGRFSYGFHMIHITYPGIWVILPVRT